MYGSTEEQQGQNLETLRKETWYKGRKTTLAKNLNTVSSHRTGQVIYSDGELTQRSLPSTTFEGKTVPKTWNVSHLKFYFS